MRFRSLGLALRRFAGAVCPMLFLAGALHAQPAKPSMYYSVADSTGVLFNVVATAMVPVRAQGVITLWNCAKDTTQPVAVFRSDAGLTATVHGTPPTCPLKPVSGVTSWLILWGPRQIGRLRADGIDTATLPESMRMYNTPLQANALDTLPMVNHSTTPPVVPPLSFVRADTYCDAALNCAPLFGHPILPPPASATETPRIAPAAGTCGTIAAYSAPRMTGKNLFFHRRRYTGTYTMWPPIDNENECGVRQFIVFVNDDLQDDMGVNGWGQPIVSFHVLPPPGGLAMPVYAITRYQYGASLYFYEIDAQAANDAQQTGDYTVQVEITGKRKP